jgi:hypothetical protein
MHSRLRLGVGRRIAEDLPASVVGAQVLARDSWVLHGSLDERACVNGGLLIPIDPLPDHLSATLDPTRKFSLAAIAEFHCEKQRLKRGRNVVEVHGNHLKLLFERNQTIVYGARAHLFIRCPL